jgi:peptide/nickel transport system substrate-binding protein
LVALIVVGTMLIGACAPAATTEAPPAATEAPAATSAPAATGPAACAPAVTGWDPTTADKGTKGITVAFEQEPDFAVATWSSMSFAEWVYQMIAVGPGRWDDKGDLVPYAAVEIPSADNGGVAADGSVTWKLKPCIFWSDGEPITSKDMVFQWKAMLDPGNNPYSRSDMAHVVSIDTPDDQTAVVHFDGGIDPAWPVLWNVGPNNSASGMLPAHIFEGKTGLETLPEMHTPTFSGGPFAIKEWVAGDHMTLVRNPNFFGDKPKLDYIDIKFVPDPETGLAALKTGDVDLMVNLAESDIEAVQAMADQGVKLRVDPHMEFEHLLFNLGVTDSGVKDASGKPIGNSDVAGFCPFKDVNVRKAIMLGIDRLGFIKSYLKEDEKAFIATLWPNSSWTNTSLQPYPFDPDQANQLLDAAGYKAGSDGIRAGTCDGKPVKFSLGLETTNAQRRIDNMAAIQAELKKIGIDVKPNPIPAGTFFGDYASGADMATGKFDMAIFTTGYYPDPDAAGNWECAGVPSRDNPNGANNYHICDPKLDEMWKQGLASADPAARKKVYDQIQQYMYDNVLMVPLYARANVYAYQDTFVFPPTSGSSNFAWDAEYFDTTK